MSRTTFHFLALAAALGGATFAIQRDSSVLARQAATADVTLAEGDSNVYVDAAVVSPECASSADPLACTADADAATLADDATADAASAELTSDDGAVAEAPAVPSAADLAAAVTWVDPLASDPSMDDS